MMERDLGIPPTPLTVAEHESQPFLEFVRAMLRYIPAVVLLTGFVGAVAYRVTTPEPTAPVANAQIGLTQRVVWPFFDASRQRAITTVLEPSFADTVSTRIGDRPIELTVEAPDNQAFLIIEVTGQSVQDAVDGANVAADLLIELDRARLAQTAVEELELAQGLLDESVERESELRARIQELVPAEAEAGARVGASPASQSAREALLAAQLERSGLTQLLNEELRVQVALRIDADEADAGLTAIQPELEILRRPQPPEEAPTRSWIPVIGAMLATASMAAAAAVMYDRARGRVASAWYAEQVAGVPVLADTSNQRLPARDVGLFLANLVNRTPPGQNIIAVASLSGSSVEEWLDVVVEYFEVSDVRSIVVVPANSPKGSFGTGRVLEWADLLSALEHDRERLGQVLDGVSTVRLPPATMILDSISIRPVLQLVARHSDLVIVVGSNLDDRVTDMAISVADRTVLLTRLGVDRVDRLRRAARSLRSRQEELLGVVLDGNRSSKRPRPTRRPTARTKPELPRSTGPKARPRQPAP